MIAPLGPQGENPAPPPATAAVMLALPTLAQAAFWVILAAFGGVLVVAVAGNAPVRMEPIVLSLFLLPARRLMSRPDDPRHTGHDPAATQRLRDSGHYDRLLAQINALATEVYGHTRPIGLLISRSPADAQAVSSWRRDYVVMGHELARMLVDQSSQPWTRALLLHEIAHIAYRDSRRLGFAGELLRGSVTILPWWILFVGLWVGVGLGGARAALDFSFAQVTGIPAAWVEPLDELIAVNAATRADILQKTATLNYGSLLIFLILSLWPIALTGGILYFFYWRWMLRLQEHYADLALARAGHSWQDVGVAMGNAAAAALTVAPAGERSVPSRPARFGLPFFGLHPDRTERQTVFQSPERLFADWRRVAAATAALSIGLDLIFASPLFLYHPVRLHLTVLTGLLLLGSWLLPQLVLGRPFGRELARILAVVIGVRAAWLALNLLLLGVQVVFMPLRALELLNVLVIAGSRYVGNLDSLPVSDLGGAASAMLGAVGLEALQLTGLLAGLGLYLLYQRRAAAHYYTKGRGDNSVALRRGHWLSILLISVLLYAVMWPIAGLF